MSEVVLLEVGVKEKLVREMKERKASFREVINNIIREYFEIRAMLEGRKSGCNNM